MTDFLNALRKFIETVAPALAVALWNYKESQVVAAEQQKEAAELAVKNLQDEKTIRENFAGKSDAVIIDEILSSVATRTGEPAKPKPDGGS